MRRESRLQIVYGGTGICTFELGVCVDVNDGYYWMLTQQWFQDWYIDKVFSVAVHEVCCTGISSFILVHTHTSNMHVKLSMYVHVCPCNLSRYLPPLSLTLSVSLTFTLYLSVCFPPPPFHVSKFPLPPPPSWILWVFRQLKALLCSRLWAPSGRTGLLLLSSGGLHR